MGPKTFKSAFLGHKLVKALKNSRMLLNIQATFILEIKAMTVYFKQWYNYFLAFLVKMKLTQSCWTLWPHGLYSPWNCLGQNTGGSEYLSLLQGIFPTQESIPGLPSCRWILYQLSHKGNPRRLEWVAYPFSRGSSWPGIEPGSPALQVDSLPTELSGKPLSYSHKLATQDSA